MTGMTQVENPAEWRGEDLRDDAAWVWPLSEPHRAEVLRAVAAVEDAGSAVGDLSRETFPLPTLGPVLARFAGELLDGRGFGVLRGVPVEGLSERQGEIVTVGLGCHIGGVVPQGADGTPVIHVRDTGIDPANPTSRSYQHSRKLGYHTDPTDLVALLCLRPAKSGGLSSLVSSIAVHDEIVRTRPDLAEVLYEPWWFDRRSGDGPDSFYTQPVYAAQDGRITAVYGPDYMRSAQRGAHVPPFTPAQLAAMDLLDRLNDDPRFVLTMDLRAGDMQFLNNHVVMHSRTAYQDHPEPERRRHLIRLWLTAERDAATR
jgi:Taurine catabolism dioxygenase TauD, TfdA family